MGSTFTAGDFMALYMLLALAVPILVVCLMVQVSNLKSRLARMEHDHRIDLNNHAQAIHTIDTNLTTGLSKIEGILLHKDSQAQQSVTTALQTEKETL
jgi:hypothetical protein